MPVGMGELGVIAIVFGSVFAIPVAIVAIICGTILILSRRSRHSQRSDAAESRMIQEIYQGLLGFEKRVESLEALLLERERPRKERSKL